MYPCRRGKGRRIPKVSQVFRIPVDSYGDSVEQWKKALSKYNEEHHPDRVKLVLPVNYSTARMTQIPYVSGKQLSNMAHNVMLENGLREWQIIPSCQRTRSRVSVCAVVVPQKSF